MPCPGVREQGPQRHRGARRSPDLLPPRTLGLPQAQGTAAPSPQEPEPGPTCSPSSVLSPYKATWLATPWLEAAGPLWAPAPTCINQKCPSAMARSHPNAHLVPTPGPDGERKHGCTRHGEAPPSAETLPVDTSTHTYICKGKHTHPIMESVQTTLCLHDTQIKYTHTHTATETHRHAPI